MDEDRKRPLKVGLYIPNGVGPMADGVYSWDDILAMASTAEAAGFDSVWVADHMLFRFPGEEITQGRWECWSLLAALAAVTSRVEIGPLVSCMSFRNPGLLAKMAETVDEISHGRLVLAVGAGWHEPEYTAFDFPYDLRASRFEESFAIVKELLATGRSNFNGTFHHFQDAEVTPRGPRPGGIPLIVGTNGERLLRVAAASADGWNTTWVHSPAEIVPLVEAVDRACDEVGRDPQTLSRSACVLMALIDGADGFPFHTTGVPDPVSPSEAVDLFHQYAATGLDEVMIWPDPNTMQGIEQFGHVLYELDRG